MITIYTTYNDYLAEYGGTMKEAEFLHYAEMATFFLNRITFGKLKDYAGRQGSYVSYCTCVLADKMREDDVIAAGGNVKSVSNDGYSETYITAKEAGFATAEAKRDAEYTSIAMTYIPAEAFELGV